MPVPIRLSCGGRRPSSFEAAPGAVVCDSHAAALEGHVALEGTPHSPLWKQLTLGICLERAGFRSHEAGAGEVERSALPPQMSGEASRSPMVVRRCCTKPPAPQAPLPAPSVTGLGSEDVFRERKLKERLKARELPLLTAETSQTPAAAGLITLSGLICARRRPRSRIVCPRVARICRPKAFSRTSKRCLSLRRTTSRTSDSVYVSALPWRLMWPKTSLSSAQPSRSILIPSSSALCRRSVVSCLERVTSCICTDVRGRCQAISNKRLRGGWVAGAPRQAQPRSAHLAILANERLRVERGLATLAEAAQHQREPAAVAVATLRLARLLLLHLLQLLLLLLLRTVDLGDWHAAHRRLRATRGSDGASREAGAEGVVANPLVGIVAGCRCKEVCTDHLSSMRQATSACSTRHSRGAFGGFRCSPRSSEPLTRFAQRKRSRPTDARTEAVTSEHVATSAAISEQISESRRKKRPTHSALMRTELLSTTKACMCEYTVKPGYT